MAIGNFLYDKARERYLKGQLNWLTDDLKAILVDTGQYTPLSTHEYLSSIIPAARIAGPSTLDTKTADNGVADARDVTFAAVSGTSIEAIVIYKQVLGSDGVTPDDAQSILIAYIDTATGLPITPNSGDIIVTWDNGVNKIFRL